MANPSKVIKDKQKDLKKEVEQRKKEVNAFIKGYRELCKDSGLQIDPLVKYGNRGVAAMSKVGVHYEEGKELGGRFEFFIKHNLRKFIMHITFRSFKFLRDYRELCLEHKLQLNPQIEITERGIEPKVGIIPFNPTPEFEVKDWDEAKKENDAARVSKD